VGGPRRVFHDDFLGPGGGLLVPVAVAVLQRISLVVKSDGVEVDDVGVVYGVAPGDVAVEPHGRERRAEEAGTEQVPAFAADDVAFVPLPGSEEGLVRVDEHERLARRRLVRTDGPHVGADVVRHALPVVFPSRQLRAQTVGEFERARFVVLDLLNGRHDVNGLQPDLP